MNHNADNTTGSFDLSAYLAEKRRVIDDSLEALLNDHCASTQLCHAMHYSLMGSGKRLRPILCIAAAEAVGGGETSPVMRTACALEMIHTYSLIHDDLPAMDDDDIRRGRPTCHVHFDEATAVLAGDALLTLAFEVLTEPEALIDHARQLRIAAKIAACAGNRGMIDGQMQDMIAQGQETGLESLKSIHERKTGAMIEAALFSGATAGGGTDAQVDALSIYGRNIGLAFQITDDILNVEGDPDIMGKSTGTDQLHKKATYPSLLGLDEAKKYAAECVSIALQSLSIFDNNMVPLAAIARYITERKR